MDRLASGWLIEAGQAAPSQELFAVVGDIHGHFDLAAAVLDNALVSLPGNVAAVFFAGDVEALRAEPAAAQVHGPPKYRKLGEFHRVLKGEIGFLCPVYFIGGNHEPRVSLNYDGGLVTGNDRWDPGVTCTGWAGAADIRGLRVAFLSGIHSPVGSARTLADRPIPLTDVKSRTYWVQEELRKVRADGSVRPVDLLLPHDWPKGPPGAGNRQHACALTGRRTFGLWSPATGTCTMPCARRLRIPPCIAWRTSVRMPMRSQCSRNQSRRIVTTRSTHLSASIR